MQLETRRSGFNKNFSKACTVINLFLCLGFVDELRRRTSHHN
jgi:hypothetical protein